MSIKIFGICLSINVEKLTFQIFNWTKVILPVDRYCVYTFILFFNTTIKITIVEYQDDWSNLKCQNKIKKFSD